MNNALSNTMLIPSPRPHHSTISFTLNLHCPGQPTHNYCEMNHKSRTQDIRSPTPSLLHPLANLLNLFRLPPTSHIAYADFLHEAAQIAWERVQDVNPLELELEALWARHFPDLAGATQRAQPFAGAIEKVRMWDEIVLTPSTGRLGDVESALDTPALTNGSSGDEESARGSIVDFLMVPEMRRSATPPPPPSPLAPAGSRSACRRSARIRTLHESNANPIFLTLDPSPKRQKRRGNVDRTYRNIPAAIESPAPSPALVRQRRRRTTKAERLMNASYRDTNTMAGEEDSDDAAVSRSGSSRKRRRVEVDGMFRPSPSPY